MAQVHMFPMVANIFITTIVCVIIMDLQIVSLIELETSPFELQTYPIEVDKGFEGVVGWSCFFN